MPTIAHIEQHFKAPDSVRDVVIGMSDGLTVPFALAAGLSGAVMATSVVVTAGFAEIVAGSIAMGLGGYLASKTDEHHYYAELARERREVVELPERESDEVREILTSFGLDAAQADSPDRAARRPSPPAARQRQVQTTFAGHRSGRRDRSTHRSLYPPGCQAVRGRGLETCAGGRDGDKPGVRA